MASLRCIACPESVGYAHGIILKDIQEEGIMKKLCWGIFFMIVLGMIGQAEAQEPPPPYEGDFTVTYYVDNYPYALNNMLLSYNACLESFMRLNPDIVIYDIPFGTLVRMPRRENCYDYSVYPYSDHMNAFIYGGKGVPLRLKFYENGQWLDEPYYSDDVVYIGGYKSVEDIAKAYHICLDDLLAENYLLQHYDDYAKLLASLDVFIPDYYPRCYLDSSEQQPIKVVLDETGVITLSENTYPFSLHLFAKVYNVCAEEVIDYRLLQRLYTGYSDDIEISIPTDAPPCYNEQGQRLQYFDENNQLLETPIYSDLPIYIVQPQQTIQEVATITGACILDLMRANQFIHLPMNYAVELFIPPAKPCPSDIQWLEIYRPTLQNVALSQNICLKTVAELNPHLITDSRYGTGYRRYSYHYDYLTNSIVFIKYEPCYQTHVVDREESIYDIEHWLNICHEDFFYDNYQPLEEDRIIYTDVNVLPCYNQQGQRLQYPPDYDYHRVYSNWQPDETKHFLPIYSSLQVYLAEWSDSLYEISRRFNVCVEDLLRVNPSLRNRVPPDNYPVFIPQVQPCYDEETGLQFIYIDENGEPLLEPILSDKLIHYFGMPSYYLAYYYNVCYNRISDANEDKYDENRKQKYWGTIIPTDRPPCYDENWFLIDYRLVDKKVHTVLAGENIISISRKYNVPYPLIIVANDLYNPDMIWVGQKLIIPTPPKSDDAWWLVVLWAFWGGVVIVFIRNVRSYICQEKEIHQRGMRK